MPTPTYTPLANITLGSSASSVTFSNIPNTYRDLIVVLSGATDENITDSSVAIRLNSDSGSNYSWVVAFAEASGGPQSASTGDSRIFVGRLPGNSATAPGSIIFQLMDYSATDKHKSVLSRGNHPAGLVGMYAARWANTNAITSIQIARYDFAGNLKQGTTASLYGVIA